MMHECVQGQFPRQSALWQHDELRERSGTAAAPTATPRPRR